MEKNYIAVDLGATSGRVILAKVTDGQVEMETIHRFPTPLLNVAGKYYWNIFSIYDDILKGLAMVGKKGIKVESIGIDTWGVDFVCVGKDGSVSLPRAYRDPYTDGVPDQFFKEMSRAELYDRTGIQIMNFNSVFQMYAQYKEGSEAYLHADKLLFVPDALSYMLTGNMVCEYTILSTSALMDPRTKKIDGKILDICGLKPEQFPEIVYPGAKVGSLTPYIAEQTGLGDVAVLAVAGHDTGSAVAAVPAKDEHFAYLSSGTWSLMGIEAKDPVINAQMFDMNFTNEGGIGGTTRLLKNITGMWILEQCLAKWREEGRDYNYVEVAAMAAECSPCQKLFDPDAPEFAAPTDMPAAIRKYCEENGIQVPAGDAHMLRLIYDSLAGKYAQVFRKLCDIAPFTIDTLHIIGGGSQNAFLNQLTADACGVKVVAGPAEGTALGNVMVQAGLSRTEILKSIDTKIYNPNERIS